MKKTLRAPARKRGIGSIPVDEWVSTLPKDLQRAYQKGYEGARAEIAAGTFEPPILHLD